MLKERNYRRLACASEYKSTQTKTHRAGRHSQPLQPRTLLTIGLFALVLSVALSACNRGYSRFMKLPVDPVASSGLGWGVVSVAYASLKTEPRQDAKSVSLLRAGTVFACLERRIDSEGEVKGGLWYLYSDGVTRGWLHDSDLRIFPSEEQARKAAISYQ